jgi:FkbH-like protein
LTKPIPIDSTLQACSRPELRALVSRVSDRLNVMWAQKLVAHCATLEPEEGSLRIGIVRSFTSELLDPWLKLAAALQGLGIDIYHAPYGLSLQEAEPDSGLVSHAPDVTVLLLDCESVHPAFNAPLVEHDADTQRQVADVVLDRLCSILERFRSQPIGHMVLALLPARIGPALGTFDAQSERSQARWWSDLKGRIAACLRTSMRAASLLDLDELLLDIGRSHFFDRRLWYSARFPFAPRAAFEVATRIVEVGVLTKRPKAKVIALDADNTLWGGIIGEDGIEGIALGPDYPGNCYLDFQRRLLDLEQRGFVLALCSKNNAADVEQVLSSHPHQLIKDHHFVAKRVNWLDKATNLRELADELNLGLSSFVFVDDSAHEIAAVRRLLPEVEAVQMPLDPLDVPTALEHVARLQTLSLTAEDQSKTGMYIAERERRSHKARFGQDAGALGDYLSSLDMRMQVVYDSAAHVGRLAQLTQKTNQFNLTTRRRDEQQLADLIAAQDWLVAHFSLTDIFGDSGIVGLALVRRLGGATAELDSFLMSCRVIGRNAEQAFLATLLRKLKQEGVRTLFADYLPTSKNGLVADFLPKQGFSRRADGRHERRLDQGPAVSLAAKSPIVVTESNGAQLNRVAD